MHLQLIPFYYFCAKFTLRMKKTLLALLLLLTIFMGQAQSHQCGADDLHNHSMANDPEYARKMNAYEAKLLQKNAQGTNSTPQYVIPVVVHVMHKGEAIGVGTNITDEEIKEQLRAINERYRKVGSGAGDGEDIGIEFALAVRDPQGNCTNGINRINMSANAEYMANGVYRSSIGITDASLKAISFWNSNQYYNIWLVSELDNGTTSVAGYAYFAPSHGSAIDGAVLIAENFRNPNQMTPTHELGHALNLYHTFEGDNDGNACPVSANGCGSGNGDCCGDTPAHIRSEDCNISGTNSCDNNSTNLSYKLNYMDYSGYCQNMFTANQKTRMISALTTLRASLLASNGNMSLVPPAAPVANFEIKSGKVICTSSGLPVILENTSSCTPQALSDIAWNGISFLWTVTNGTNTYTFTSQNPSFTLTQTGSYDITLTVTNSIGSSTITKSNVIFVIEEPAIEYCTPTSEYNGNYSYTIHNVVFNSINNTTPLYINDEYENFACSVNTIVKAGETYPLSLSAIANNNNHESFKVYIDYNNNASFEVSEMIFEGTNPASTSNTYTTNITIPANAVKNTLLTMRVIGCAGNISDLHVECIQPYFVGDVEDYGVYVTDGETSGLEDNNLTKITISPNPVDTTFSLSGNSQIDNIEVYNMLGQLMLKKTVNASQSIIDISNLSVGAYIVHATAQNKTTILKILKK